MSTTQAKLDEEDRINDTTDQFLTFILGNEEYGIEILKVQEIKSWGPFTPIPNAPEYVLGVINLRGAIVPIVDLRSRFGLPPQEYTTTTAIIIVHTEVDDQPRIIGLVVDQVSEVYHLGADVIQNVDETSSGIDKGFIRGYGKIEEKLVILVNLEPIIASSMEPESIS